MTDNDIFTEARTWWINNTTQIGFTSCKLCGAAIFLDPADSYNFNALQTHRDFHNKLTTLASHYHGSNPQEYQTSGPLTHEVRSH